MPGKDGTPSLGATLRQAAKTSGKPLPERPPPPFGTADVLSYFASISEGRQSGGFGPLALSSAEILAWCVLSSVRLTPWEFRAVRALDNTWLDVFRSR